MKVINKNDVHSPGTVILELSQAEYVAISYYAQYYADAELGVRLAAIAAAKRFPTVNGFNYSSDFQGKLFR